MKAEYRVINEIGESCSGRSPIHEFTAAIAWKSTVDDRHDHAICGTHCIQTRLVEDWFDVERIDQPAVRPERCPTCGSDNPRVVRFGRAFVDPPCDNPWHFVPSPERTER
jgi:hypothetical protein